MKEDKDKNPIKNKFSVENLLNESEDIKIDKINDSNINLIKISNKSNKNIDYKEDNFDSNNNNISEKLKILVNNKKNDAAVKVNYAPMEKSDSLASNSKEISINKKDDNKITQIKSDYSTKDSFCLMNEKSESEIVIKDKNNNNNKANYSVNNLKDDFNQFSILQDSKDNLFDTVLNQVQNKNRGNF